ncbi:SAV_2336 N-terminal domain-related protein [Streptomyces sp. NPDC053367]|uniref:SAV_2336 N-terminal domain-related protein n=1 Tax=Streptomyces sp. NPDC053367 TaxID=3365700 RepID=UPI0037D4644A
MLAALRAALLAAGIEAGPEELADILWLATRTGAAGRPGTDAETAPAAPPDEPAPTPPAPGGSTTPYPGEVRHYAAAPPGGDPGDAPRGTPVRVRRASGLSDPLALMRALRPLAKRTVPGVTGTELDEERTVVASVEQHMTVPVLTPRRSRWIDLALVVDTHHSMLLWHDLIDELSTLVQRAGVFRDVRVWFLSGTDGSARPRITSVRGGEARSPQEVTDPTGHRLTVVLTDGVAPGWGTGAVHDVLRHWAVHSPLCMVHLLPRRLWGSAALPTTGLLVQASQPAAPNASWRLLPARARRRRPDRERLPELSGTIAVPVVEATASGLGSLASIVDGGGRWHRTSCLAVPKAPAPVPDPPAPEPALPGPAALRRFQETASPLARELAGCLSAVPLTLPVMTLVRRVMLPEAEHGHLAEVALGGLLVPWEQAGERPPGDMAVFSFDFLPGVREALLGAQRRQDVTAVQELVRRRMGRLLEHGPGPGTDFPAVRVASGEAVGTDAGRATGAGARPFAESAAGASTTVAGESDAVAPGVHPFPFTERARDLPEYVERDFDTELRAAVRRAAAGDRVRVVLVGDALAGKSRSAVEAVKAVLPGWPVHAPGEGPRGREALPPSGSRTVLWLDDLERFGHVEALLRSADTPRLVLATVRSDHWERLRRDPAWKDATVIRVPLPLTAAEAERARTLLAHHDTPLLEAALDMAAHGSGFRGLTVVPALHDAYRRADDQVRALVDAAAGALSLGCRTPLPAQVLASAARDHLPSPRQIVAGELPRVLERATAAVVGGTALLARHVAPGEITYYAHEVLVSTLAAQHLLRWPASLLDALGRHASRPDLAAVIQCARERGLRVPEWPVDRLGPSPDGVAVRLWDRERDRPLCSGVLLSASLVAAPARSLREPLPRVRISYAADPAAERHAPEADSLDEATGLAFFSLPDASKGVAALSLTDPAPGQRFTVVGAPPYRTLGPTSYVFVDTTAVTHDTLRPQPSAHWSSRTVTGAPVVDEAGRIAGIVTDVTDAGLTLRTARDIAAAADRAHPRPTRQRQPGQAAPAPRQDTREGQWAAFGNPVPFLARLERRDRERLLALGRARTYARREVLLRRNDPSREVLLIVSGRAKVTASSPHGYEALLGLRGPGDLVGEEASLDGGPRSVTVTALEQVDVVAMTGDTLSRFLQRHPAVSQHLLAVMTERMRQADRRHLQHASMTTRERLAALLLDLARTHGRRTEAGILLDLPLTNQELAGAVGASREATQRTLKELRGRNIVATSRNGIEILHPEQLRAVAGPQSDPRATADVPPPGGPTQEDRKVEVALRRGPPPAGQPPTRLVLVAAAYLASDPYGDPAYVVHGGSVPPDGAMYPHPSGDGPGLGGDEVMTLELDRIDARYARVVLGVLLQQGPPHGSFADVPALSLRIREGDAVLHEYGFAGVPRATAASTGEFVRDASGSWTFRGGVRPVDPGEGDVASFTAVMGGGPR